MLTFVLPGPGVAAAILFISDSAAFLLINFDIVPLRTPPTIPMPSSLPPFNSGDGVSTMQKQQRDDERGLRLGAA